MKALDILREGADGDEMWVELYPRYLQDPERMGKAAAYSTMTAALRDKLGYTPKRLTNVAIERDPVACAAWFAHFKSNFTARQMLCVDEVGINKQTFNRRVGHSKKGRRASGKQNFHKGARFSALGIFDYEGGFIGTDIVANGFNTERFKRAIKRSVLKHMTPWPGPRSVLVYDGAGIHNNREVIDLVLERGGLIVQLEPYDPQHMPIEIGFRALKDWMRKWRDLIDHMAPREQLRMAFMMVHERAGKSAFLESGYESE